MQFFRMRPSRDVDIISAPASGGLALDGRALAIHAGNASVLFARAGVSHNGFPALPLVILAERDEIRVGGETYYLAAEKASAVAFTPRASETRCARCKTTLTAGEQVIFCPSCRSAHHPACWSYAPTCAACPHDSTSEWRPE